MNSNFFSVFTTEDYLNFPTLDCFVDKKLANTDCSVNEVKCHLLKLKTNKSAGPDHVAPCILKSCALELASWLAYVVNKSFSIGLLPDEWKHAEITPLHKKGSNSSRENYRPISLTSVVCKIGEKIVLDRMIKFWRVWTKRGVGRGVGHGLPHVLSTPENLSETLPGGRKRVADMTD